MWWRAKTSWSIKLKPKVHIFSPCTNFYDCQQKNCCGFRDSEAIPINNLFLLSRAILFMSCPFSSSSCFRWCVCIFRGCRKKVLKDQHSLSKRFNMIACLKIFSQPIKGQCLHQCCCPGGFALLPLPGNGSCYCQVGAFCCSHNAKVSPSHFSHHCQSFIGERTIKVPFGVHLWHMLIIWDIFHPILWRMKKKAVISV